MSDTTVTQAPPAPASQPNPPSHTEVPINQNQTSSPNPIGPQAPEKPANRSDSVRDSIQRAYDRAANPPPKGERAPQKAAPAAEAKSGHNQPPEETKPERIDLRKRPSADAPLGVQRTERGQFAPRVQAKAQDHANRNAQNDANPIKQGAQNSATAVQQLPAHAPYAQPPQRMSEKGKAEWHATPESVRGDVNRMTEEFVKAYRVYKGDFDEMSKIRHFHKMAKDHGTDLHTALTNYVGMEEKLRADPVAGLDVIVNNLNLRTPDGQKLGLRDIAYHVLSQSPEQLKQLQMGNQQQAAGQQIMALNAKIDHLQQSLQQMHTQTQFNHTRSAIDVFADSHPRFDELGTAIENELKLGFDLETAYKRADRLYPATQAAQTRTTPAQTRPADRSIHGTPEIGSSSNGTSRRRVASPTARDAVANAIKRVNGSI